jgi:hypothetical protein
VKVPSVVELCVIDELVTAVAVACDVPKELPMSKSAPVAPEATHHLYVYTTAAPCGSSTAPTTIEVLKVTVGVGEIEVFLVVAVCEIVKDEAGKFEETP